MHVACQLTECAKEGDDQNNYAAFDGPTQWAMLPCRCRLHCRARRKMKLGRNLPVLTGAMPHVTCCIVLKVMSSFRILRRINDAEISRFSCDPPLSAPSHVPALQPFRNNTMEKDTHTEGNMQALRAIVVGGTGAIGKVRSFVNSFPRVSTHILL